MNVPKHGVLVEQKEKASDKPKNAGKNTELVKIWYKKVYMQRWKSPNICYSFNQSDFELLFS